MVEVERLLCNSQFCDLERRGASLHLRMAALAREAEVDDLALEDQADALREELLVLSGHLKQAGLDVTVMLNHLLIERATRDLIRRMTSRVESLRKRVDALPKPSLDLKSPAVPVVVYGSQNVPGAATITPQNESRPVEPVRKRRRHSLSFGDNGEVLPRQGLFPVFVSCRYLTLKTVEGIAIWAFHVLRTYPPKDNARRWLADHWTLPGPTAFLTGHNREELLEPPCDIKKFDDLCRNRMLQISNLHEAAVNDALLTIRIAYLKRESAIRRPAIGTVHHEAFKAWAVSRIRSALESGHNLTQRELLRAFAELPDATKKNITPNDPTHYFKTGRYGWSLTLENLYKLAATPIPTEGAPAAAHGGGNDVDWEDTCAAGSGAD